MSSGGAPRFWKEARAMRKSRAETAATRERIVEAAAGEFRRNGIGATGLSNLMGAAGLTHGGFYKHFASKEQAVAEACAYAIEEIGETLGAAMDKRAARPALHGAINAYLTVEHRDNAGTGCPFAALGAELARGSEAVRESASAGLDALIARFAARHAEPESAQASTEAMLALSSMIGALVLSRIVTDDKRSRDILRQMRSHLTQGG